MANGQIPRNETLEETERESTGIYKSKRAKLPQLSFYLSSNFALLSLLCSSHFLKFPF